MSDEKTIVELLIGKTSSPDLKKAEKAENADILVYHGHNASGSMIVFAKTVDGKANKVNGFQLLNDYFTRYAKPVNNLTTNAGGEYKSVEYYAVTDSSKKFWKRIEQLDDAELYAQLNNFIQELKE